MTLGRTSSGAIKIKTDEAGGGLRAVSCACCGGCDQTLNVSQYNTFLSSNTFNVSTPAGAFTMAPSEEWEVARYFDEFIPDYFSILAEITNPPFQLGECETCIPDDPYPPICADDTLEYGTAILFQFGGIVSFDQSTGIGLLDFDCSASQFIALIRSITITNGGENCEDWSTSINWSYGLPFCACGSGASATEIFSAVYEGQGANLWLPT